jgi:predicted nucleic acid-binding protein
VKLRNCEEICQAIHCKSYWPWKLNIIGFSTMYIGMWCLQTNIVVRVRRGKWGIQRAVSKAHELVRSSISKCKYIWGQEEMSEQYKINKRGGQSESISKLKKESVILSNCRRVWLCWEHKQTWRQQWAIFFFPTKNLPKTGACSHHRATTSMHNPMIRTATKRPLEA